MQINKLYTKSLISFSIHVRESDFPYSIELRHLQITIASSSSKQMLSKKKEIHVLRQSCNKKSKSKIKIND